MGKKKFLTEEEKKEAKRISNAKWYQKNRERELERMREWRAENNEKIADYRKGYYQKNKERELEQHKEWYQKNKERELEQHKKWREQNPEYWKEYIKTPMGRALYLVSNYKQDDKEANRGECTLTARWIVDNIFTQKCRYCQKDDWTELGCDRVDNDLPHTPDNVVCCCEKCNKERGTKSFEEFLKIKGIIISDITEIKK